MAERYDFYVHDDRKITFNLTEPIMREDSGVTDFVFHIPKILNELEVSDWQWWLVFVNAKKEKYSIALTLSDDPESPLEKNVATYTVDYAMSIKAGSVQFALEAINTGTGGAIDNEWHTLTYETKVKETLQGNQAEYAETESDIISELLQTVRNKVNQLVGGATPEPKQTVAQMTDPEKIYLYTGTGDYNGYWYYHNGTQFVPGGIFGVGTVDTVPTQGSTNAVQSGGVYSALEDKADKDDVPETVTPTETDADFYLSDANGNVLLELADGHIKTKNFDSSNINTETDATLSVQGKPADAKVVGDAIADVEEAIPDVSKLPEGKLTTAQNVDLDVTDTNGNVILRLADGHIRTKNFDSSRSDQNAVLTVNNTAPDANGNVNVRAELDPEDIAPAVEDYLDEHPVVASGGGVVSVADYGAVGDGVTDDSQAIQNAVNSNYDVYFESDKTYYLGSTVTINHDIKLHGGKNTWIKTKTPTGGIANVAFSVTGTLKKTTALTTDYTSDGNTDNSGNQFTLADMTDIAIGDLLIITAKDQYYSYARQYYYLGAVLLIGDIYNGHLYTTNTMPWDITNSARVTAEIYSAPTAIFENLHFVSDLDSRGNSIFCIRMEKCKDSIIRNCELTTMDNGIFLSMCANTLVEDVHMSKSKWDNTLAHDGYGLYIGSCSNTIVQRMMAICAQSCVCLSGSIPNINTYVRNCDLASECRINAMGSHENAYNTVVEDCTLAGLNVLGTATVRRCRFITNNRTSGSHSISFCGNHNPKFATLKVEDCIFDKDEFIYVNEPTPQNPIHAFDNIIGIIEIKNCNGAYFIFDGETNADILSNEIQRLVIDRWTNCKEIYHTNPDDIIDIIEIKDTVFSARYWINNHREQDGLALSNVRYVDYKTTIPIMHKIAVNRPTYGEKLILPENTSIQVSSNNNSAQFLVCGENVASNDPDDYVIGYVSGSDGGTLSRTKATGSIPTITQDASGNLVYTQAGNTSSYYMYPACMFYVPEMSTVRMSAVLKNTGGTSGATFRPYMAIVDCDTGNLITRSASSAVEATTAGASIAHSYPVKGNCIVMCYFYCGTPVASSETTFEDFAVSVDDVFAPSVSSEQYKSHKRTGDGTLLSFGGVNNIMCSEFPFNVSLQANVGGA